jgi:hypothetical protein
MTWTVNTTERFGGVSRAPRINPYIPARTELFTAGGGGAKVSYLDIGKPVVLNGNYCTLATSGQQIYGFIESVEAGTSAGYAVGGVLADPGLEVLAVDEVGNLAVGDIVVAGTPTALGTATPTLGAKVIAYVPDVSSDGEDELLIGRWQVLAYYGVQGAGKQVMLRRV